MRVPLIAVSVVVGILALGTIHRASAQTTPIAAPLNPFLVQQARFTNVQYFIYPSPLDLTAPLITEGNLKAGPMLVHPHFGVAENYTDNVFRTDKTFGGRSAEWYTAYQPGIQIQLPIMGRHKVILDYRAYLERYSRDSSLDVNDQTLSLNPVFEFPGGLTIKLLGELKDGHDYRGSATATPTGNIQGINKFYNTEYGGELELKNQAYVRAMYKSIRWQFIGPLAGPRDGVSFGDINTRNRLERNYQLALGARIAPKSYLYLSEWIGQELYEVNKDLDSTVYTTTAGLKWEATAKTTGDLQIGWQQRNMTRASTPGGRGTGNFSGLYFQGVVQWRPQEQTLVNWMAYRRSSETVLGGTRYYVATGTTLDLIHAITKKWNVTGQFMFERDQYSDPIFADNQRADRQDNYTTLAGGLWYQVQPWLGIRATYGYTQRLSNFISAQYNANQAMVSIQGQF